MLPAATIIPKCDSFFSGREQEGGKCPLYSSSREAEKQNSNYDTELEKLETHIMMIAGDRKMYFWKITGSCPTEQLVSIHFTVPVWENMNYMSLWEMDSSRLRAPTSANTCSTIKHNPSSSNNMLPGLIRENVSKHITKTNTGTKQSCNKDTEIKCVVFYDGSNMAKRLCKRLRYTHMCTIFMKSSFIFLVYLPSFQGTTVPVSPSTCASITITPFKSLHSFS